jgi:ribosomal protein S27E
MSLSGIIDEIKTLEHFNAVHCVDCGLETQYHSLQIYAACPECGRRQKLRSFGGIGTEIQDVFDAVLEWFVEEGTFENALKRYQGIKQDRESDNS